MSSDSWAIILAGGNGHSLKPAIDRVNDPDAKRFCAFCGNRSLLEQTVHRAIQVVGERIVTVVNQAYAPHLPENLPGAVIEQPEDKGTAPGVFLAASYIRQQDERARIIVLPSYHFVYPEVRFIQQLQRMLFLSEAFGDHLIVAAAGSRRADPGYSWVEPGDPLEDELWSRTMVREMAALYEMPSVGRAAELYRRGCYRLTTIIVARLHTLWQVGSWSIPFLTDRFTDFFGALLALQDDPERSESERGLIRLLYRDMPETDLSSDILASAIGRSLLYPLEGVYWSDWGQRERILQTIEEFRRQPDFSVDVRQSMAQNGTLGSYFLEADNQESDYDNPHKMAG